jgi:hypothetical protein
VRSAVWEAMVEITRGEMVMVPRRVGSWFEAA